MIPQEFMASIIASKADDVPRLIAADWLDEHDEPEYAEFIRVQCRMAQIPECHPEAGSLKHIEQAMFGSPIAPGAEEPWGIRSWVKPCEKEPCVLRRRADALLSQEHRTHAWNWAVWSRIPWLGYHMPTNRDIEFRRGFVYALVCTWEQWELYGDWLALNMPLEIVRLITLPGNSMLRARNGKFCGIGWYFSERWPGIEVDLALSTSEPMIEYLFTPAMQRSSFILSSPE